jgi:hypothetical protein
VKLVLTVTLEVPNDPEPGSFPRLGRACQHVGELLATGSTAGTFRLQFNYDHMGIPDQDVATITYDARKE